MFDVIIIGAGIAGLACAVGLADRGLRVVVLEREALPGGRARSWTDGVTGDKVDIGPHVMHTEYRNMLALLDRLGTREHVTWQPRKVLTIMSEGRLFHLRHWPLLPTPLSLVPSMITAPGPRLRDHLTAARTLLRGMQFGEEDVAPLDAMTAEEFLRSQGMNDRAVDWWWRFAAMVVTNVPLERCSAAALLRIHAQLSGHRKLHFGFAGVALADLFAPGARRIIEAAGGRVMTHTRVQHILTGDRARGVILQDGSRIEACHVVSAVPPLDLAPLLPEAWQARKPFDTLTDFEPSPYISCYLWFDRRIMRERFVSHMWSPERLNYDYYDLSMIREGWEDRPSVTASNIIYSHRANGMSDDEIVDATVRELAEFAPQASRKHLRHAQVHRIPMAIPCPFPGIERKRPRARSPIPGLLLAGDWIRTDVPFCMESAVRAGWMAAEEVFADRGTPRRLALEPRPYDGVAGVVRRVTRWERKRRAEKE